MCNIFLNFLTVICFYVNVLGGKRETCCLKTVDCILTQCVVSLGDGC